MWSPHYTEDYDDNDVATSMSDHRPNVEMMHKLDAENVDTSRDYHNPPESISA